MAIAQSAYTTSYIDKTIGTSYDVVRLVSENLSSIKHVSANLSEIYAVSAQLSVINDLITNINSIDVILESAANVQDLIDTATTLTSSATAASTSALESAQNAFASANSAAAAADTVLATLDTTLDTALEGKLEPAIQAAIGGQFDTILETPVVALNDGTHALSVAARAGIVVNARNHGLIADGLSHPISSRYATLAEAQAAWPFIPKDETVTASISGTTLTVSSATATPLKLLSLVTGSGVAANTRIQEVLAGEGEAGTTYSITPSQTVASTSLLVSPPQALALTDEIDWAAIQNATFEARARGTKSSVSVRLDLGGGQPYINRTLDWTFIRSRGFFIDGTGTMILPRLTNPNTPAIDMMGCREISVLNFNLSGTSNYPCTFGVQLGRNGPGGVVQASPANYFLNSRFLGCYTKGTFYNFASELCKFDRCNFGNTCPDAHAYIGDGLYHWAVTSQFLPISAPVDVEQPFTINSFKQCEWSCNGAQTAGKTTSPIWLASAKGHVFEGYVSANTGGASCSAMTLYSAVAGDECSNMIFHTHDEGAGGNTAEGADGVKLQHNILFDGPNVQQIHFNLKKTEVSGGEYAFGKTDSVNTVRLVGCELKFGNQGTTTRKAFDRPNAYIVSGIVALDQTRAQEFWNLSDLRFTGQFSVINADKRVKTRFAGQFGAVQNWDGTSTAVEIDANTSVFRFNSASIVTAAITLTLPAANPTPNDIFDGHTIDIINTGKEIRLLSFVPTADPWPYLVSGASGSLGPNGRIRLTWNAVSSPKKWSAQHFSANNILRYDPATGSSVTLEAGTELVYLTGTTVTPALTINTPYASDRSLITIINAGSSVTALNFSPDVTGWINGKNLQTNASLHLRRNSFGGNAIQAGGWRIEDIRAPYSTEVSMNAWWNTLPTTAGTSGTWWRNNNTLARVP